MSRYTLTLLGLLLMAGFGMFFGIEIATRGMEQIQGPLTNDPRQQGIDPVSSNYSSGTLPNRNLVNPTPKPTPLTSNRVQSATTGANGMITSPAPTSAPIGSGLPAGSGDSSVNRVGNGIGDLLQGAAHQTIRTVVGVFDGLIN